MKKILITGANSYIGTSFEKYIKENYPTDYEIETVDMIGGEWREKDFSGYDAVFHVAGIAHSDTGKISAEKEKLYRSVNTDLTVETAKKAKSDGVKQFIFMSSAIVYGDSAKIGRKKEITKDTPAVPANCYGDSKLQAENGILPLSDENFKVCVLRPPMVYGEGCKGNYQSVVSIVKKFPFFPRVKNKRSLIRVDNLVSFVKFCVDKELCGLYFPQNREYVGVTDLAKAAAKEIGKKIYFSFLLGFIVLIMRPFSGTLKKAFGSLIYKDTEDFGFEYCREK